MKSPIMVLFFLTRYLPFFDTTVIIWRKFGKLRSKQASDVFELEHYTVSMTPSQCDFAFKSTSCESLSWFLVINLSKLLLP